LAWPDWCQPATLFSREVVEVDYLRHEPQPRWSTAWMLSPLTGAPVESETTRSAKSPTPVITQLVVKKILLELLTLVPTEVVEMGVVLLPFVVVLPKII
jgi:hypothetical protein